MEPDTTHPVVTVFRSRLRPDAEAQGYGELSAAMEARARSVPGFCDFKAFVAADGERVSIIIFETIEQQAAWRDDPEHRVAQRRGHESFYEEYSISVCDERHHGRFRNVTDTSQEVVDGRLR